jgi:hypothetical protein
MHLALALAMQDAPTCSSRAGCEAAVAAVIREWDKDRDGSLSRSEWTAMGESKLAALPAIPDEIVRLRREIAADFRAEDGNDDGFLTHDEMLKIRLAAFPCLDGDGDGILSEQERERVSLCGPGTAR